MKKSDGEKLVEDMKKYARVEENGDLIMDTGISRQKIGTIKEKNILENKNIWDKIVIDEFDKKIVGEKKSREILFMCALGRFVKNCANSSFNVLVHSESSAGKDYTTKAVLSIFPSNFVFSRTRISPTVLNYWKPYQKLGQDTWDGCVLYLPDIGDSILNSDAMKLLCSDGSHITVTEKGEAKDIEIKGKPVIFSTTANSTPNEEILNRFSIVHLDESEEQTRKIFEMSAKKAMDGLTCEYNPEITNALLKLRRYEVKVPFAKSIVKVFPINKISQRRNFDRFLDYIKAIAVFHQFQRTFEGNKIIAEENDYEIARSIFMNIQCGVSSIPLNRRQKEIVSVLADNPDGLALSEIHSKLINYITLQALRPHLDSLVNIKVADKHFGKDTYGREIIKYNLSEEFLNFEPITLPPFYELLDSKDSKVSNDSKDSKDSKVNTQGV